MRSATRHAEVSGSRPVLVSSCYKIPQHVALAPSSYKIPQHVALAPSSVLIEHSCLMTEGNTWDINVKCRPLLRHNNEKKTNWTDGWRNIQDVYPEAKLEDEHNDIKVTLPSLGEGFEVAAFGSPGRDDQKRMQMAIFGKRPTQGRDWKIRVYLINDSTVAFKLVYQKEEKLGNRLLTALAGLFVSNSDEDIRIEFTALDPGWQIKGNKVKMIKSKDAWNSPENSKDFPRLDFEISHVDKNKQHFFCAIKISHEQDSANTEIVALFEQKGGKEINHFLKNRKKGKIRRTNLLNGSIAV